MKTCKLLLLLFIVLFTACSETREQTENQSEPDLSKSEDKPTESDQERATILFFGNSLTAGYGVETDEAFPALIQSTLDSLGLAYTTVNAGVSGETTAGGLARIDWVLERYDPDIFVLELGANDGLRGQSLEEAEGNLQKIMDHVKAANPDVKIILAGMMIPPNYGKQYADAFSAMYPRLAEQNDVALIPFLLDGVGGNPALNQDDGIHPTVKGHKIVAENVWATLKNVIYKERATVNEAA